jgi:hypothetical protein
MKKHLIYFATAALATGLAACSSDDLEGNSYSGKGGFTVTASFEEPVTPTTRTTYNSDKLKFYWEKSDEVALFNSAKNDKSAYKFDFSSASDDEVKSGSFGLAKDVTVPEGFAPEYAFYPYDQLATTSLSLNTFFVKLNGIKVTHTSEAANTYTGTDISLTADNATQVKMPMVGDFTSSTGGGSVKFKNLTALIEITVKNIPEDYTRAILENKGNLPIAGNATVDAEEKTLTMSADGGCNAIAYSWTAEDGATKTFYFIIPEGKYSEGFDFYLEKETADAKSPLKIFENKLLNAQTNYLYYSEYAISGDGTTLESEEITRVNEELADGETSVSVDLSKVSETSKAVIYLPKNLETSNTQKVTLTLTGTAEGYASKEIVIKEDPAGIEGKVAAKDLILKTDATASDNVPTITVELPNSNVTLGDGTAQFFKTVSATVGATDQLNVEANTTATEVSVGGGDIFVKEGALATGTTFKTISDGGFLYAENSENINKSSNVTSPLLYAPMYVYQLKTTKSGKVTISEDAASFTATTAIDIENATDLIIDLNGQTLSSSVGVLNLKNSTVEIVDGTTDKKGTINTTVNTNTLYAVTLDNSSLTLTNGAITSKAHVVKATVSEEGKSSSFSAAAGTKLEAGSQGYAAINLDGATATVNGTVSKGRVYLANGATANVNVALPALVQSQASTFNFNNEAADITGTIKINEGSANIVAKNLKGAITTTDADVNIKASEITSTLTITKGENSIQATDIKGKTTVSGGTTEIKATTTADLEVNTEGELTLSEGEVKGEVTATGGKFIMAEGTKITGTGSNAAIAATASATVEITGATIVPTEGQSALTLNASKATISGATAALSATTAAAITAAASSTLTINNGSIKTTGAEVITTNKSTVEVNGGTIYANVGETEKDAIKDATEKSTITINGGEIKTDKGNALNITQGSDVTVTNGTITGTTSAITLAKGTLSVPATATTPKFYGDSTILTTAADNAVEINLNGANAYYESTLKYTIEDKNTTKKGAIKSISGGKFLGDIISDKSENFITGGYFKRCQNLQNSTKYFDTFYALEEVASDDYWHVSYHANVQ